MPSESRVPSGCRDGMKAVLAFKRGITVDFRDAKQFRAAYAQGKSMLESPKDRQDGLRHLLSVLEHLEVARDQGGVWWLANRYGNRLVNLICITSLAEAMDVSKRLITKQQELKKRAFSHIQRG